MRAFILKIFNRKGIIEFNLSFFMIFNIYYMTLMVSAKNYLSIVQKSKYQKS